LLRRYFKPALTQAGLTADLRLYDLRHTCATLLLADGENLKVVSERLGHSSITLTADVYAHVSESMQRQATDRMERMLYQR
jgi:integrase